MRILFYELCKDEQYKVTLVMAPLKGPFTLSLVLAQQTWPPQIAPDLVQSLKKNGSDLEPPTNGTSTEWMFLVLEWQLIICTVV